MKFQMNIYFTTEEIIKYVPDIKDAVLERMEQSGKQDLFNSLDIIEDENVSEVVEGFIDKSTIKEIEPYLTVSEDLVFDKQESEECNFDYLAYLVTVDFDVDKLLRDLRGQAKERTYSEIER